MADNAQKPASGDAPPPGESKLLAAAPTIKLPKGEILFSEGETSRAMYLLKSGMVRIFKRKADTQIEIAALHSGEIIGELAFLDSNPRSASAEALTDCELVEISISTYTAVMATVPDWLKILVKTVVGRLRTASTRIRQLDSASTAVDYSDKSGQRASNWVFLSTSDSLKISTGILLVGSRNATQGPLGAHLSAPLLTRTVTQVLQTSASKMTAWIEILAHNGIIKSEGVGSDAKHHLCDPDLLETYIAFQNEENLAEPHKRRDLAIRGFLIMGLMAKHLSNYTVDAATGKARVNLGEIRGIEAKAMGHDPFRPDDFTEIAKYGYASQLELKSAEDMFTEVHVEKFMRIFRVQKLVMSLAALNEQKRKSR